MKKRFRVFNRELQSSPFRADTTKEIFDWLKKQDSLLIGDLFIDCTVDDIEVDAQEFIDVWEQGERPGDLQFF